LEVLSKSGTKLGKEALHLLDGKNIGHVATISKDGAPHVTPVWIDHEGDQYVLINIANTRVKLSNMKRDPRVAVSIAAQDNPYDHVTIFGKVVGITDEGADAHIEKLAKKYTGKKFQGRVSNERRIIVRILPLRIAA